MWTSVKLAVLLVLLIVAPFVSQAQEISILPRLDFKKPAETVTQSNACTQSPSCLSK